MANEEDDFFSHVDEIVDTASNSNVPDFLDDEANYLSQCGDIRDWSVCHGLCDDDEINCENVLKFFSAFRGYHYTAIYTQEFLENGRTYYAFQGEESYYPAYLIYYPDTNTFTEYDWDKHDWKPEFKFKDFKELKAHDDNFFHKKVETFAKEKKDAIKRYGELTLEKEMIYNDYVRYHLSEYSSFADYLDKHSDLSAKFTRGKK